VARTIGYKRKNVISNAFFIFLLVLSTAWLGCSWSPDPKNYGEGIAIVRPHVSMHGFRALNTEFRSPSKRGFY
jgi:hypothetical protein